MATIKRLPSKGNLYSFNKNWKHYFFGCEKGLIITDTKFRLIKCIDYTSIVISIEIVSEKLAIIASYSEGLHILDLITFEIIFRNAFKNKFCVIELIKYLKSMKLIAISSIATNGLWFATLNLNNPPQIEINNTVMYKDSSFTNVC